MLRVPMSKSYIKRTFRPLYGWTQMTPKSVFLDPNWNRSVDIYPGMVMQRVTGDTVTLAGAVPPAGAGNASKVNGYGLAALYVGGDGVDEPLNAGINAYSVWVFGPDAEAEILAPAYDTDVLGAFVEVGQGQDTLLTQWVAGPKQGKLVPLGYAAQGSDGTGAVVGTRPVLRLLKVNAATKITVGGLSVTDLVGATVS